MKNKLIYLALIAPCSIVGCNNKDANKVGATTDSTTTSFKTGNVDYITAASFVKENYDDNALDYSTGTLNVGILNMDLNGTSKTNNATLNTIEDNEYNQNFGNFKFSLADVPSTVLTSTVINDIQGMYARFSVLTLQFLTKCGIDVIYTINADKTMDITIKTNSETALFDLISVFFPIIHTAGVFGSVWGVVEPFITVKEAEPAQPVYKTSTTTTTELSEYKSESGGFMEKLISVLGPKYEPFISYILGLNIREIAENAVGSDKMKLLSYLQIFALLGLGVAPNSKVDGSFGIVLSTDSHGYLKSASFNLWADYDLNLVSNVFRGFPDSPINGITQDMIEIYKSFIVPDLTIHTTGKANYKFGFTWGTK